MKRIMTAVAGAALAAPMVWIGASPAHAYAMDCLKTPSGAASACVTQSGSNDTIGLSDDGCDGRVPRVYYKIGSAAEVIWEWKGGCGTGGIRNVNIPTGGTVKYRVCNVSGSYFQCSNYRTVRLS